ncbi:MAG: hypothetical protein ACHQ50_01025 [Fimbriimonadales bacterium]
MCPEETIDWLMEGDPAIRWQVLRDLVGAPESEWEVERSKVGRGNDWAGRFIALQDPGGTWGGGLYSPKWTSTTYTLLTLIECGLAGDHPAARKGADLILERAFSSKEVIGMGHRLKTDLCVLGFWLRIGCTFLAGDPRLPPIAEHILACQMADGGWNCRIRIAKDVVHSSFHTTFNVLDGLRAAASVRIVAEDQFRNAEARALEFMLAHRLYLSDKSGEVIHPSFMKFSYPVRWHHDVLRGLDYFRSTSEIRDPRLGDPIELLESKRRPNGRWPSQNKHAGIVFFDMERTGADSRWNTLRALRVLRAIDGWPSS